MRDAHFFFTKNDKCVTGKKLDLQSLKHSSLVLLRNGKAVKLERHLIHFFLNIYCGSLEVWMDVAMYKVFSVEVAFFLCEKFHLKIPVDEFLWAIYENFKVGLNLKWFCGNFRDF